MQTEEVFEQHRPIVAGDELQVDVELTSVPQDRWRDLITVTNTFTDGLGERVHTCTPPSSASPPRISIRRSKSAVQRDDARRGHLRGGRKTT